MPAAPMPDLALTALLGLALLLAVGVGEALRVWAGVRPEHSRRVVHALVGVLVALAVPRFAGPAGVYALAALFAAANVVAVRRRLFPGMHGIARASWGTVTFPLALLVALAACWTLDPAAMAGARPGRLFALQAAFLVLALADPAASLVGMGLRRPGAYRLGGHTKSLAGSAVFFALAAALVALVLARWGPAGWTPTTTAAAVLAAAALATAAEALGTRGWDNLAIVVAVVVPLVALHDDPGRADDLLLALGLATAFAAAAFAARFLDLSGAVAAGVLAVGVVGFGGMAWAVPGLVFFVLSSLLSKAGRRRKAAAERLAEKSSRRDAGQVYANGGVAGALLAAYAVAPHPALWWGFVGAFAAAAADTWGTEIGTLVGGPTRQLLTGRRVPPGTSGGVSLAGTAGAVAGAGAVAVSAAPWAGAFAAPPFATAGGLVVFLGAVGVGAAVLDSALGASWQARYRAPDGAITERAAGPDGAPLPLAAGVRWLTNDRVNLACTLAGGLLPVLAGLGVRAL